MTQALYAHMNNKKKLKLTRRRSVDCSLVEERSCVGGEESVKLAKGLM
jgi:hypothetical protein